MSPAPPIARKEAKRIAQLGRVRTDDYAWLKDENWRQVMRDPSVLRAEIRAHLEAENAYTKAMMAHTEALQETLYLEMRGRMKEDESSVPSPDGPYEYYRRFEQGAQHPIYARKPAGQAGPEFVLLDADTDSKGKDYYKVSLAMHSPDHVLFAYAVDEQGAEVHTIYVKDLESGALLPDPIRSAYGDFAWSPCGAYLFWTWRDMNGRPSKVYRRPARGGAADDVLIHEETDDGYFISLDVTESRAFILIGSANHEQSEYRIIPAHEPTAAPTLFHPRDEALLYTPLHWNGRWLIHTNADGATDFKVMECPLAQTGRAHWRDFLPHVPGRYILGLHAFERHLVRLERAEALPRIVICGADGAEHAIAFSEQAYDLGVEPGYEYATARLRFVYDSPSTPRQWIDYDMDARTRTLRKTQEIPSGHDPAAYETRRLFAEAPDGARVPITVLMRRGQTLDGSAPMLLYGYGSYAISMDANFSIRRFSLVDRGWIYAIAHVRGGAEMGFGWFQDGRKFKKTNSFTDFIACAETLIAQGYARAGRIVAEGGSAGGMLMGAIANMRPDLWAGVIGEVPFVDVLNTMSDDTLPLTPPEWPEWGNPLEDEAAYDYIASYSPYDNVRAAPYPAVLATGGLSDPRVTYWEPAKWVAKLRAHTTSGKPVLLKMNMEAGHGGASGRFEFLKELAFAYAFALEAVSSQAFRSAPD